MALIKCPECNREISDKSKVCIHCGYPLDDKNTNCLINGISYDVSFLLDDTIPVFLRAKQLYLLTKCDMKACLEKTKIIDANKEIPKTMSLKQQTISDKNVPQCPFCKSTNIRKIGGGERAVSILGLGIFSKKINKSFKCNSCGGTF